MFDVYFDIAWMIITLCWSITAFINFLTYKERHPKLSYIFVLFAILEFILFIAFAVMLGMDISKLEG